MNTYDALSDGSIVYRNPIPVLTTTWTVDPENPCRLVPNVPVCNFRRIELRTLDCGLHRADWHCQLKGRISVKDCVGCMLCQT
jgi:hypothetical protein